MTALLPLTEEEAYLVAILTDPTGIDQAEFLWADVEQPDFCFRLWDYQWEWLSCLDPLQADACSRAVGKSLGIQMRAFAHPFVYEGAEMLITAPELNHLRPVVDKVETRLLDCWLTREMLPENVKGKGINRQPQWQARFTNGSTILSRLPGRDGKGVKGIHSVVIELDEAQDYPLAGWNEIIESRNSWVEGSMWRVHGVSRGVRDMFHDITTSGDVEGVDAAWTVHRMMQMMRPTWGPTERRARLAIYKSTTNPNYRRNVYGEHGDATNPVFVLARLTACVDREEGSTYNSSIYHTIRLTFEELESDDNPKGSPLDSFFADIPGSHIGGWVQGRKRVTYNAYYGGMDVGLTNHPSEILIFGERGDGQLDILLRVHMERIQEDDQRAVVRMLMGYYGARLKRFGIDRGGVGFPIYQSLRKEFGEDRLWGWTFDEKVIVGFDDRPLEGRETQEDLAQHRRMVEHATDVLRNNYVDPGRILIPFDVELLAEWQGQTYTVTRGATGNPYGRRQFSDGSFHCLDAAKLGMAAMTLPQFEAMLKEPAQEDVLDRFIGQAM